MEGDIERTVTNDVTEGQSLGSSILLLPHELVHVTGEFCCKASFHPLYLGFGPIPLRFNILGVDSSIGVNGFSGILDHIMPLLEGIPPCYT